MIKYLTWKNDLVDFVKVGANSHLFNDYIGALSSFSGLDTLATTLKGLEEAPVKCLTKGRIHATCYHPKKLS